MVIRKFKVASVANDHLLLKDDEYEVRIYFEDEEFTTKEEKTSMFQDFENKYIAVARPISKSENGYAQYAVDFWPSGSKGIERAILLPLKVSKVEVLEKAVR